MGNEMKSKLESDRNVRYIFELNFFQHLEFNGSQNGCNQAVQYFEV